MMILFFARCVGLNKICFNSLQTYIYIYDLSPTLTHTITMAMCKRKPTHFRELEAVELSERWGCFLTKRVNLNK